MPPRRPLRLLALALLAGAASGAAAQPNVLQLGTLWETAAEGGNASTYADGYFLRWPGGYPAEDGLEGASRGNSSGPRLRILLKDYLDFNDDDTPFYEPTDPEGCLPPPAYQTTKFVRTPRTATVVVDGAGNEQSRLSEPPGPFIVVRPDLVSDEVVQSYTFYTNGLVARSRYYAWANPYHDDYVIREVTLFNTGNVDCDPRREEESPVDIGELYLGYLVTVLHPNNKGDGFDSFDDRGTLDGYVDFVGEAAADPVRVLYGFDGDDPDVPGDDRGDPFPARYVNDPVVNPKGIYTEGELLSAMYPGYGLLHADAAAGDPSDAPGQPFVTGTADWSTAIGWRKEETFRNVFGAGQPGHIDEPDLSTPPVRNRTAGWMGLGPYELPAGDSLRFVFVHAVGGPTTERAQEVGGRWARGEISDAEKNAFIATHRDTLVHVVEQAQWNWDARLSQGQSIPMAPRPPTDLRVVSAKQRVELTWTPSTSPTVAGYRVYRRAGDYHGDVDLIAELPASATTYSDEAVALGTAYYYSVTATTDGSANDDPAALGRPIESSRFYNLSVYPARAFRGSLSALDSVRVVPNPFNLAAAQQYVGEPDRITFTNLTTNCTIRIFNVAGDLIKTLVHREESAYEHWAPMLTDENLFPSPGVYIYHILDEDTGESAVGKFIIIR